MNDDEKTMAVRSLTIMERVAVGTNLKGGEAGAFASLAQKIKNQNAAFSSAISTIKRNS